LQIGFQWFPLFLDERLIPDFAPDQKDISHGEDKDTEEMKRVTPGLSVDKFRLVRLESDYQKLRRLVDRLEQELRFLQGKDDNESKDLTEKKDTTKSLPDQSNLDDELLSSDSDTEEKKEDENKEDSAWDQFKM